ncbi:HNH endonuclease signature motif containing protein [Brachybacterium sp. 107]|uniref:HNH endonuclease signature motif containing protein n=1 Tax=Brachybacterium sp. 107 TaxID=3457736 RepID=UPI004034CF92
MRERTKLYAREQELLTSFLTRDPESDGCIDSADISALKVATGLRASLHRAECLIRDAHRSAVLMPGTFEVLSAGDLPEDFHQMLLRKVRALPDDQVRVVDEHVAGWDLASISRDQFARHLGSLITLVTAGTIPLTPESERRVDLEITDPARGIATLSVTGPTLEIKALAHRLDVAAQAIQKAQRHALNDSDSDAPIPFDIDEVLRQRGRAMSLAALRYAVLTQSMLDTDPVPEPASPYKLLVTVPAMTLLGESDAPGVINGLIPVPEEQARALAAGQSVWQRILTDPTTGAYLPVTADTYTPTAQMRLQLRLRHPVCAAPGCTRATVLASEDDHIEEYDHTDPAAGGPTSLANLHRLCWLHHKIKTAGLIDPERGTDPVREQAQERGQDQDQDQDQQDRDRDQGPGTVGGTDLDPRKPADPDSGPDQGRYRRIPEDPPRFPPATLPPRSVPRRPVVEPTQTRWTIDGELRTATYEEHDLLTPVLAAALDRAWDTHLRAHADATRIAQIEAARPARDRITEQRRIENQRMAGKRGLRGQYYAQGGGEGEDSSGDDTASLEEFVKNNPPPPPKPRPPSPDNPDDPDDSPF